VATRDAVCSCGQLHATVDGDPVRVSICHCLACQRRTGSAFGVQARFASDQVRVDGRYHDYVRISDEGGKATFHFCPDCGATVFYEIAQLEGFIAIPVGGFADPAFPPPIVSIYESRQHPWLETTAAMEHHD
jgi:hypothetical protein